MFAKSVYHIGERAMQQCAGEVAIADRNAVVIADTILAGARLFIEKQFMVVLASLDAGGAPWSSILYGRPGFARPDGTNSVVLDVPREQRDPADPFWTNILHNPPIGMLFIELGSRRRYRINGSLRHMNDDGIGVLVREAYPNCPKYIQRRQLRGMADGVETGMIHGDAAIDGYIANLIRNTDTVFVASSHPETGADASHRGGNPGFVQILDERRLRIPDYVGNSLFNTLGNLQVDPRVGLCVPDFDGQKLLQLSGRANVLCDVEDPDNLSGGTHRFWEIEVERWLLRGVPQRLEWEYLDASPFNPATTVY